MNAAVLSLHAMVGVGFPVRLTPHLSVTKPPTPAANCTSVIDTGANWEGGRHKWRKGRRGREKGREEGRREG